MGLTSFRNLGLRQVLPYPTPPRYSNSSGTNTTLGLKASSCVSPKNNENRAKKRHVARFYNSKYIDTNNTHLWKWTRRTTRENDGFEDKLLKTQVTDCKSPLYRLLHPCATSACLQACGSCRTSDAPRCAWRHRFPLL